MKHDHLVTTLIALQLAGAGFIPASFGAETVILSETFEGNFPNGVWNVGDSAPDGAPAFWSRVDAAFGGTGTHGGTGKGYCAGIGFEGNNLSPLYQNSMTAFMSR